MNEHIRLKEFRKAENMTQAEFSEFINAHLPKGFGRLVQNNLSNMEKGVRLIPTEYVKILHDHKLMNYDWWFSGEGSRLLKEKDKKKITTDVAEIRRQYELLEQKMSSMEREFKKVHADLYDVVNKLTSKKLI